MIPLYDLARPKNTPVVTYTLVSMNVAAYIYQLISADHGLQFACVPNHLFHPLHGDWLWSLSTLVTNAFLHGDFWHILFNMLFLWIFGDNVEDRLGHFRFLVFYLLGAVVATLSHVVISLGSPIPIIGASGAISAVMGAYAVFFPWAKIRTLLIIIFYPLLVNIPALFYIGIWFGAQILNSIYAGAGAGVAWWAHIGGFLFGFIWSLKIWDRHH